MQYYARYIEHNVLYRAWWRREGLAEKLPPISCKIILAFRCRKRARETAQRFACALVSNQTAYRFSVVPRRRRD